MLPAHQPLLTQLREPPRRRFIVTSTSAVEVLGPGDLGAPPTSLGWQSAGPRLRAPLGLWDAGSRPPPQNQTQLPVPGALHALQTVLYWSVYEGPSRDPSDTCVGAPQRQGASRGAGWINGSCRQVRGAALTAESASARSGSSRGKPSPARAAHAARGPFPSAHGRPCLQSLMPTPLSEGQTFRSFEGVRVPPPSEPPAPGRHCGGGSPSLFVPSLRLSPDSSGSPRARPSAVFCRGTERNEGQSQAPGDRARLSVCLTEDAKRGSGPALSGVGVPCGEAPTCPANSVDPQSTLRPGPGCPPDPAGGRAEPP